MGLSQKLCVMWMDEGPNLITISRAREGGNRYLYLYINVYLGKVYPSRWVRMSSRRKTRPRLSPHITVLWNA